MSGARVFLVRGDDPVLAGDAVRRTVDDLVGDLDRQMALVEFAGDEYQLGEAVDAASTPPFLVDRRVVVVRNARRFSVADLAPLIRFLQDPLPTTDVVIVWERPMAARGRTGGDGGGEDDGATGGRGSGGTTLPKALTEAVKAAGGTVLDTAPPRAGQALKGWLDDKLGEASVRLDPAARDLVRNRLGEDLGRVVGLLAVLEAAHEPGAKLGADDVEPYLGEAGGVPPWELTDAIDSGDRSRALGLLHRMLGGGARHPLAVMAPLVSHYQRMLRLEGSAATDEKAAAALLGIKGSTFPAKKALTQTRRLGTVGVERAIGHLARADAQLRGDTGLPDEAVMELLVDRLCALAGTSGASTRRR